MGIIEQQLRGFFSRVGDLHASNILFEIGQYMPMMLQYPYIVEESVGRFAPYFTKSPADNHVPALRCLHSIAHGIPAVRPRIIEQLGPILLEYYPIWATTGVAAEAEKLLKVLELPLSEADRQLRELSRSVVALGRPFLLIIGAGFSYDTMPITRELEPLMIKLLREIGVAAPKKIVEEDEEKAWGLIRENSGRFKDMFAGRCSHIEPAPQHRIVTEMFKKGNISHIVSFNWDDLIEKAYRADNGEAIPKVVTDGYSPEVPSLWKLHGDVEDLNSDWVFPYDKGRVFNSLLESLLSIKEDTEFALIIGYSEYEEEIRDKLILWLEENVPTVLRIRPNWEGPEGSGIKENSRRFFVRLRIYFELEKGA